METLKQEFKEKLIDALNLEDLTAEDINNSDALFGDGLGLDSIDALEIILILEKDYGIRFENPAAAKEVFYSVDTIVDYIYKNRA